MLFWLFSETSRNGTFAKIGSDRRISTLTGDQSLLILWDSKDNLPDKRVWLRCSLSPWLWQMERATAVFRQLLNTSLRSFSCVADKSIPVLIKDSCLL